MDERFEMIPGRYGIEMIRSGERKLSCRMELVPSLMTADCAMRSAAILMAVDMACGASAGLGVLPLWTVTADAEIHLLAPCTRGPLRVDAECIRAGRTMSVSQARIVDEGANDRLIGVATANHGVLTPKFQPPIAGAEIGSKQRFTRPEFPSDQSLEEYFGLEIQAGEGRIPSSDRSRNPWGIVHGGLHGLLVDALAHSRGVVPRDVVMRFLNPVREGAAVARVVDSHERGAERERILRIEISDSKSGRLCVVAHVVGREGSEDLSAPC